MRRFITLVVFVLVSSTAGAWADIGLAWQAYLAGAHAQALAQLQAPAEAGDADAQYAMGSLYSDGLAVPRNYRKAAQWFGRAAEQGHAKAEFSLGFLTYYGAGRDESEGPVPSNPAVAASWLKKAADKGYALAQVLLADMYHHGDGVRRDKDEALRWALAAARQDLTEAQYEAGYLLGSKWEDRDAWTEAYKWFRLAADKGFPGAEQNLRILARRLTPREIAMAEDMARRWRPNG